MSKKWIRLIVLFSAVLLSFSSCLAEKSAPVKAEAADSGAISHQTIGLKKDILYRLIRGYSPGFVLIALEGSGMNPRKKGTGITWNADLQIYNIIDFSIANELSNWQDRERDEANDIYSEAVISTMLEHYDNVRSVGIFAFSKGACGADSICRRLTEKGIPVAFVWLCDAFTAHELTFIMQSVEKNRLVLYNRYSKKKRLNVYSVEEIKKRQLKLILQNGCTSIWKPGNQPGLLVPVMTKKQSSMIGFY